MKIGVLDIQGSVDEHLEKLRELSNEVSFEVIRVKSVDDLNGVDEEVGVSGLIIPGGESTTIGMLLRRFGLRDAILARAQEGMVIWGTCAGAILLAKEISGEQKADTLGLMDIVVVRNGYGRQLDSFEGVVQFDGAEVPAVFIRAPKIESVGEGVKVLAQHEEDIVACRQGKLMVTTFHPELTSNLLMHRYFLGLCS